MRAHQIVSNSEWLNARRELLAQEKELTRSRDRVNAARLALPWVKIERNYRFEGPSGPVTLDELFEGRSQLIIQHFMLGPDDAEGCIGCSFAADHVDGAMPHLLNHDVSLVMVSRAPIAKIDAYRTRMGWKFSWVSSSPDTFSYDFHASFTKDDLADGKVLYNFAEIDNTMEDLSGYSVFIKDDNGDIFHTYSSFGRGNEELITTYIFLDMTPHGRNEHGPNFNLTDWVRRHDQYDDHGNGHADCHMNVSSSNEQV